MEAMIMIARNLPSTASAVVRSPVERGGERPSVSDRADIRVRAICNLLAAAVLILSIAAYALAA